MVYTIQIYGAADDGCVASEPLLPKSMAQDHIVVLAGGVLAGIKGSAEFRSHAQYRKQFCGNECCRKTNRLSVAGEIEFVALGVGGNVHGANLLTQGDECAFRIRPRHVDQLFRFRIWKRGEQNSVHQAENSAVRADAESQGEHGDGSEAWRF